MADVPNWVEKLLEETDRFLEGHSPGPLEFRFVEAEGQLVIAPGLVEMVGGSEDGTEAYPFFSVHLSGLMELFDQPPEVLWTTMHDELHVDGLHVEGKIDGQDAWVTFQKAPFDDAKAASEVVDGGMVRPKRRPGEDGQRNV